MEGRHHVQPCPIRLADGFLAGRLEVVAMFDQLGTERPHRAVLLDGIAMRHIDRRRDAGAACRERQAPAVITARRRDDAGHVGLLALEPVEVDEPAAYLEGADRRVVLVLDHDRTTEPLRQQRPGVRRGRRDGCPDDCVRTLQFGEIKHGNSVRPIDPRESGDPVFQRRRRKIERSRRTGSPGQAGR